MSSVSNIHQQSIVIDGLIISKWDKSILEDMRRGGLTAANCTVSIWEGFAGTIENILDMKQLIRDNADLALQVRSVTDIRHLTEVVLKKTYAKRTTSRLKFELGNGVELGVATYNLLGRASKPSKMKRARADNEEVKVQRTWVQPTRKASIQFLFIYSTVLT